MHITIKFLLVCALAVPSLAAAEVYKYRDARGHIHLTDKPMRGMQLLKRYSISTGGGVKATAPGSSTALADMYRRRDRLTPLIERAAQDNDLRPELVHAVVRAESAYRADAISSKGAVGLMQLMPATAERYGVSDRSDAAQNLQGGSAYLRDLLQLFDQDLRLALAAYNAGENAVIRFGNQIPPYDETQGYVRRVMQFYNDQRDGERIALR